jgi:hypothetical protein
MSVTMPDLWPEDVKPAVLSPVAILRTQAALLSKRTDGLLEAVVESSGKERHGKAYTQHRLELEVPPLNYYRHGLLVVEHENPGAYPVYITSSILDASDESLVRIAKAVDTASLLAGTPSGTRCDDAEAFVGALRSVLSSQRLKTLLVSLLAQINDAKGTPSDAG